MVRRDCLITLHDHRSLDEVFEFADITRPIVGLQQFDGSGLDGARVDVHFLGESLDKPRGKFGNILLAFPEWREHDGDDIESIVEVFPEPSLPQLDGEVSIGRGDHAHVDLSHLFTAHRLYLMLLEHSEKLSLQVEPDVAHLIQEDGTPSRLFEFSRAICGGSRERTLYVTEHFAFEQVLGYGYAVDRNEGPCLEARWLL